MRGEAGLAGQTRYTLTGGEGRILLDEYLKILFLEGTHRHLLDTIKPHLLHAHTIKINFCPRPWKHCSLKILLDSCHPDLEEKSGRHLFWVASPTNSRALPTTIVILSCSRREAFQILLVSQRQKTSCLQCRGTRDEDPYRKEREGYISIGFQTHMIVTCSSSLWLCWSDWGMSS